MMYWGSGTGGWGMVLVTVGSLLFWALVIAGIVTLVRYACRGTQVTTPGGGQHHGAAGARRPVRAGRDRRGRVSAAPEGAERRGDHPGLTLPANPALRRSPAWAGSG